MKIACSLPNASNSINGVAFTELDGLMVSEDITPEAADGFIGIPGYEVLAEPAAAANKSKAKPVASIATESKTGDATPE